MLALKKLAPTRLIKNKFYEQVSTLENQGGSPEDLTKLLGKGRAKKGIFEGDLQEGELEIGQISSMLIQEETVAAILTDLLQDYQDRLTELTQSKYTF